MSSFELPSSWGKSELETLFIHVIGGDWGKDETHSEDGFVPVKCIRGAEFKNWYVEKGASATLRKIKSSSLEHRRLQNGDILIEISGGGPDQPVGRTVLIDESVLSNHPGMDVIPTNFLRLARPSSFIDSGYLNAYLRSFYLSGDVNNYQGGSNNLRNLKFKDYVTIEVPIAPLAEQKQIAAKLDELLAQVDTIKTRLNAIPAILKRFRQSVLAAAVSGRLTEDWRGGGEYKAIALSEESVLVPNIWDIVSLNDVIDPKRKLCYGVVQPGENVSNGIELIRVCDINNGKVDWSSLRQVSHDIDHDYRRSRVQKGDVLVTIVGAIGRIGIVDKEVDANIARAVARLSIDMSLALPSFVHSWLSSPSLQWWLVNSSKEVARKTLNLKELKDAPIALPAKEEQLEITRRIEKLFAFAEQIEKRVKDAQSRVNHLTQSVLAKAFRGELTAEWREQNPDLISGENSVQALLERIKAEQANLTPGKRGRRKKAVAS